MPSRASSSVDLMVAVSRGFTLQICLIITLSFRCKRWGWALLMAKFHWHGALCSAVHMATCLEREVAGRENWYQPDL